ncbi:hypothetical protein ACVME8_009126 [Bradyrhizobium diazoefficiens]
MHLDAELGKGAREVGDEARPLAGLGRAEQQRGIGQLMGAVRRRVRAVRPADQEGGGDDEMERDGGSQHQGCDLPADTLEVEEPERLHRRRPLSCPGGAATASVLAASVLAASVLGVNR